MKTVQVCLPDELVRDADELGLLEPTRLEAILRNEIRQYAFGSLLSIADKLAAAGVKQMSDEEVLEEVRIARMNYHAAAT